VVDAAALLAEKAGVQVRAAVSHGDSAAAPIVVAARSTSAT